MKKYIFCIFICWFCSIFQLAAYSPSDQLQQRLEYTQQRFEELIDEHGESLRENIVERIEYYKKLYIGDEKKQYILKYLEFTTSHKKPNILLIIADDVGKDVMPGYEVGEIKAHMPNISALMENGLSYTHFWTNPTCTPTRGTMLTGKYGDRTGVRKVDDEMPLTEKPLQSYLTDYNHAVIGKWHLSHDPEHPANIGIESYKGMLSGGAKTYWDWRLTENSQTSSGSGYITSAFTDYAIDWLQEQDEQKPWFLWLAYTAPHTPFHLPPAHLHSQDHLSDDPAEIENNPLPYYMAALEAMDSEIGRLLSYLSEQERENTLIIFMGDNGTPGKVIQEPYARRKAKGSLYEGGINTPLFVSGYGVLRSGEIETNLVSSADMFATILDIGKTGISQKHDSYSFSKSFLTADMSGREFVFSEVDGTNNAGITVRNTDYKLIEFDDGEQKFYDMKSDPYELNNLLRNPLSSSEEENFRILETYLQEEIKEK